MLELKPTLRRIRRFGRVAMGRDPFYRREIARDYCILGQHGAQFAVIPDLLSSDAIVYSFGIGTDISFDLELIGRFGVEVHAFDPTPRSLAWLKTQRLPENFKVYEYGVSASDGTAVFALPSSPSHVSHSVVLGKSHQETTISAPVRRISSIMKERGHERIDLLKMDIEGAEYDVIDDLVAGSIPVRQLCVEFHHRWPEIGAGKTRNAIDRLRASGYRIFHASESGEEYSFMA
jgi:FkbM family methyltransferase